MYLQTILLQNLAADSNLNQTTETEVNQHQTHPSGVTIPDIAASVGSSIGFFMAWLAFFVMLSKLRSVVDNKRVLPTNNSHKLPCQNCEFFCSNNYLKCAVQPAIVMTEEAKDCSDYSPKAPEVIKKKFFR